MLVKDLIKALKKMPQEEEVGWAAHDYDCGDSDPVSFVVLIDNDGIENESGELRHRVVMR